MQNSQHIRSAFDRALESLQANMLKMGGLVEVNIMQLKLLRIEILILPKKFVSEINKSIIWKKL